MNWLSLRNIGDVVQDFGKITRHSRRIHGTYLKLVKKKRKEKITTYNWLDLETLGF
jgi:hypothetical protein